MTPASMSERVRGLFHTYVGIMRAQAQHVLVDENEAKQKCLFLLGRLQNTYGHIEHEILGDELEAAIKDMQA